MAEQTDSNIYARAAILKWLTDIFHVNYSSFADVESKDVAVLLHAIFSGSDEDGNREGTSVSLHDIQFCKNPTPTIRFLNAKRVLSLVHTLSSSMSNNNSNEKETGIARFAQSAVGNMTASAWIEGKAFVEELKMWRWIRAEAFKRRLEVRELESRVQLFLSGASNSGHEEVAEVDGIQANVDREASLETRSIPPCKRPREEETFPLVNGGKSLSAAEVIQGSEQKCTLTGSSHKESMAQVCKPAGVDALVMLQTEKVGEEEGVTPPVSNIACTGTAAAPLLLSVLDEVKKELEEQKNAAAAAATVASVPHGSEPCLSTDSHSSGPLCSRCLTCPTVFAAAIQQNYDAIERLESLRQVAVAACLKRDVTGLLNALTFA
ncbi:uncharacterized protein TM35_000281600 [Trypanosoma theileri]|uniref:Uncharacterized protein n=1 Tax=Trypanosoma theileri TaxID=67003 RepID=A0A1X0NP09_9TRYP|nr:uncharacterized protein TM35_000281600 [Trypanosoma theileri]ORC86444.1 hypothetical protein TM35_000281600 [Trypanosoma theileri]